MGIGRDVREPHVDLVDARSDPSGNRRKLLEIEPVDAGGIASEHWPHLFGVDPSKGVAQGLGGVRVRSLDMWIVLAPHDLVEADVVTERCLVRTEKAGADE